MTGNDLKMMRLKLKLTQEELAKKLLVHQEVIVRWEKSERIARPGLMIRAMKDVHREILADAQNEFIRVYAETNPETVLRAAEEERLNG